MSELLRFFNDMRDNGYGLAEIAAQLGTSAIAEPVAGFAAMYDPVHGADAIREGMTYQPRTQEAQQYSQSIGNAAKTAIKPAMPIIDTWKKGVDIAGQYSPVVGAGLRTVPAAIGIAMGAKPALQAGRQASEGLGAMQGRMIANANAPRTLNAGYMGQRGVFAGINALTADKQALAKAQQMIAQGVDPAKVWKDTGWGRGADGKWRFEIDDSKIDLHDKHLRDVYNVIDAMDENDLLKAYPVLKKDFLAVGRNDRHLDGAQGMVTDSSTPNQKSIALSRELSNNGMIKTDELKSVLMHELQHAIQSREGFAVGGNPEQFIGKLFSKEQIQDARILSQMMSKGKTLDEALKEYKTLIGKDPESGAVSIVRYTDNVDALTHEPFEAYKRLAGEVEARTTQSRLNLDSQQRRDNYPFDFRTYGYDRPAKSQTVDFDNNKAMSQKPLTEFEQAHLTAQRNAALPVEKGGLGLPADNTAMDRARAMGFDVDTTYTHRSRNTPDYFQEINPKKDFGGIFSLADDDAGSRYGQHKHEFLLKGDVANNIADEYSDALLKKNFKEIVGHKSSRKISSDDMDTIRYVLDNQNVFVDNPDRLYELFNAFDDVESFKAMQKTIGELSRKKGYGAVKMEDEFGDSAMLLHGNKVRYKDAAFDPMQRQSSNLLAQSAKLAPTTALGAYMYNEKRKKSQGNQ